MNGPPLILDYAVPKPSRNRARYILGQLIATNVCLLSLAIAVASGIMVVVAIGTLFIRREFVLPMFFLGPPTFGLSAFSAWNAFVGFCQKE